MKPKTDPEYKLALEIEQMARRHTLDFLIECGRVRKEQRARAPITSLWQMIQRGYVVEIALNDKPRWQYSTVSGGSGGGGSMRTITIGGPSHVL